MAVNGGISEFNTEKVPNKQEHIQVRNSLQSVKILLLPSKYEIIFVTPFKNCNNIGLFSIAPHIIIALPTISTAIVVALLLF